MSRDEDVQVVVPDSHGAVEPMVTITTCASRVEAHLAHGALVADGLRPVVLTDDAGGVHPQLGLAVHGAVRIAVPAHEVDRARDLLGELASGAYALPSSGEHERIAAPPHGPLAGVVTLALLGLLLAYRAVTMVWPGLG